MSDAAIHDWQFGQYIRQEQPLRVIDALARQMYPLTGFPELGEPGGLRVNCRLCESCGGPTKPRRNPFPA